MAAGSLLQAEVVRTKRESGAITHLRVSMAADRDRDSAADKNKKKKSQLPSHDKKRVSCLSAADRDRDSLLTGISVSCQLSVSRVSCLSAADRDRDSLLKESALCS
jgi:hypothetical protein